MEKRLTNAEEKNKLMKNNKKLIKMGPFLEFG